MKSKKKKPEFGVNKQPPLDHEEWMNMGHTERRDIKTKKTPNIKQQMTCILNPTSKELWNLKFLQKATTIFCMLIRKQRER
jgi:hypothetical protein